MPRSHLVVCWRQAFPGHKRLLNFQSQLLNTTIIQN